MTLPAHFSLVDSVWFKLRKLLDNPPPPGPRQYLLATGQRAIAKLYTGWIRISVQIFIFMQFFQLAKIIGWHPYLWDWWPAPYLENPGSTNVVKKFW